jgi:hypothetical protein
MFPVKGKCCDFVSVIPARMTKVFSRKGLLRRNRSKRRFRAIPVIPAHWLWIHLSIKEARIKTEATGNPARKHPGARDSRVAHPATGGQRLHDPSCNRSVQTTMTTKACNNRSLWSTPTSWEEVCRRAAGRRHYNGVRRVLALARRREVARLLRVKGGLTTRGTQAAVARELGVSRSTISRDVAYLLRQSRPCPCCGALVAPPLPEETDCKDPGAAAS